MQEEQIITLAFMVAMLVLVGSARTCFAGTLVGFDFSWLGIKWGWSPFTGWVRTEVDDDE